ncbi:unnamed protein product [Ostreobium quekettii]|uniref:Uncharacterized protein n=1 Tax=Ostreobium quekettii TaxID=121088 RepID=A0A8S1JAP5_9CHLO|nr:unnamed protein product [Ostreobium quekettii]
MQGVEPGRSDAQGSGNAGGGGKEAFQTVDGGLSIGGARKAASTRELSIRDGLSEGDKGRVGARGGRPLRTRRKEGRGNGPTVPDPALEDKGSCPGKHEDAHSTMTDNESKANLSTPEVFGTPIGSTPGGFGSPVLMPSSGSLSPKIAKMKATAKGKKAKDRKKRGTGKKRRVAQAAEGLVVQDQNVDSGNDAPTAVNRSGRKRKPRVYLAEEDINLKGSAAKKEKRLSGAKEGRAKAKISGLKRGRSSEPTRAHRTKGVLAENDDHKQEIKATEGMHCDVAVPVVGKRLHEDAAELRGPNVRQLKLEKRAKKVGQTGHRKRGAHGAWQNQKRSKLHSG